MRKRIVFFVSYAHANKALAKSFLDKLYEVLAPSKKHEYVLWSDKELIVGEEWRRQIIEARDKCDLGLLLVSPSFLGSKFISGTELPTFVSGDKPSIPVMLQPIDFSLHDLKGLGERQIFRLDYDGFKEPKAYGDCKKQRRDSFVLELFKAIESKLELNG